jgi:hypothetical protein
MVFLLFFVLPSVIFALSVSYVVQLLNLETASIFVTLFLSPCSRVDHWRVRRTLCCATTGSKTTRSTLDRVRQRHRKSKRSCKIPLRSSPRCLQQPVPIYSSSIARPTNSSSRRGDLRWHLSPLDSSAHSFTMTFIKSKYVHTSSSQSAVQNVHSSRFMTTNRTVSPCSL